MYRKLVTILALIVTAIGIGGIKPSVAAFGGDQFVLPQQEAQLTIFFSVYYFSINMGATFSEIITPILRKDVHCMGEDTCYSLAFGEWRVKLIVMKTAVKCNASPLSKILKIYMHKKTIMTYG